METLVNNPVFEPAAIALLVGLIFSIAVNAFERIFWAAYTCGLIGTIAVYVMCLALEVPGLTVRMNNTVVILTVLYVLVVSFLIGIAAVLHEENERQNVRNK